MRMVLILTLLLVQFQALPFIDNENGLGFKDDREQLEEPEYARWGKLAVEKVKERYPDVKVVDYLHVGRKEIDEDTASETFKLWMRGDDREFGVFVTITFEKETDEVLEISYEETDRG
ncbi:DUF3889 domain-containing protein [Alteribacter aurantiacus]|uniref:DUF3889 domain-containing protein n=1 Tax=Alteribacter aurantiacus TaxID=254410 RepID=UPI00041059F1|nr:DUF3889 domain-containing protein [Alteribacter aurantiacus]